MIPLAAILSACNQTLNDDSVDLTVKTYVYFRNNPYRPFSGEDTTYSAYSDVFVYKKNTMIVLDTFIITIPPTGEEAESYMHHAPNEALLAYSMLDTVHHLHIQKGEHILIVRYNIGYDIYRYYFRKLPITSDMVICDSLFKRHESGCETLY